ncbi:MAG TPA: peptidoglycan DD-metalloendopeptidase family protein [Longimicrobiaceae bacterium]
MRNSQRLLAFAVFAAFAVALASAFAAPDRLARNAGPAAAALLPAAHANPVDVSIQDTLRKGETISELLRRVQLAEEEAGAVLAQLQEFQDPRRMRPGAVISYRRSYVDGSVRGVAFTLDADRMLSMQRNGDSWSGSITEVPVRADTAVLSGTVLTSLYAALLHGDGDLPRSEREQVADLLADKVFAWQVDFSRDLRKGDEFRILYERAVRPDGTARSGRVLAVQFNINNRDYEAYYLADSDGSGDYYERDGESLRRAFLRAPLQFRRISSSFSLSRFHPILKRSRPHYGIDYSASAGTPVRAVGDGTVVSASRSSGYGNVVEIRHKNGYTTRYAHLRGFAKGIRRGVRVQQEDVIGYVGMTGLATGPHLHYEFRQHGKPVDPNSIEQISGDPVPPARRAEFTALVDHHILAMDAGSPRVLLADARNLLPIRASE